MRRIIYKHFLVGLALWVGILLLTVQPTLAGGWAVVTLDRLPPEVVAGQPLKISFMIRQHGRTPWVYDQVMVHAIHLQSREKITVPAKAEGVEGHYAATLKFSQAGKWQWGIASGLMPAQQPMPDLIVLDATAVKNAHTQASLSNQNRPSNSTSNGAPFSAPLGVGVVGTVGAVSALLFWLRARTPLALALLTVTAVIGVTGLGLALNSSTLPTLKADSQPLETASTQVALTASAELGRALFIAKGCIVCHRHNAVSDVRRRFRDFEDFSVGPDLPTLVNDPKVLRVWLKDPSAAKPNTEMPNLELKQPEIEALIAFLLDNESASAAANAPPSELAD